VLETARIGARRPRANTSARRSRRSTSGRLSLVRGPYVQAGVRRVESVSHGVPGVALIAGDSLGGGPLTPQRHAGQLSVAFAAACSNRFDRHYSPSRIWEPPRRHGGRVASAPGRSALLSARRTHSSAGVDVHGDIEVAWRPASAGRLTSAGKPKAVAVADRGGNPDANLAGARQPARAAAWIAGDQDVSAPACACGTDFCEAQQSPAADD
jgi:hypothetical protein